MSKTKLYADAEKLYLYERMSPEQIAEHLQVSRRVVYYWKKKFNWDKKLAKTMQNNQFFRAELQGFILNLIKTVEKSIDNKEPTNSAMLYSVINLLKNLPELQKYEQAVKKEKKHQKFELTQDFIDKIKKEYCKYNNYSKPQFYTIDVLDYIKEKQYTKINILIIQNILSTFAKLNREEDLKIFISNLFDNIISCSSENVNIIINDVNHIELYRDNWLKLFIEKSKTHNYKTKTILFDGYDGIEDCEKYLNSTILYEYPINFDKNDNYNKTNDCMKYIQLLMKKG